MKRPYDKPNVAVVTIPADSAVLSAHLGTLVGILEEAANEIFLITGKFPQSANKKIHVLNLKCYPETHSWLKMLYWHVLTELRILASLIRLTRKVDILMLFTARGYLLPILWAKLTMKRTIVEAGGHARKSAEKVLAANPSFIARGLYPRILGITERFNYTLCDVVAIALDSESIIQWMELEKYRHKLMTFGFWAIDTKHFSVKSSLNNRGNVVGYVGRLSGEKGVLQLAKAIPLILDKRSDAKFLIVGDGPLMMDMIGELKKAGCMERVDFAGWAPYEKVPDYLNQMRFHILPSYTEAFGGVCMEAMACGAISLAPSVGGIPDIMVDNETGFLLKDNSPQTIANKIMELWENPHLDEIQRRARAWVEQNLSFEKAVEKCQSVFKRLS